MKVKITAADYHRNGVMGTGFYVILFDWKDGNVTHRMVATWFPPGPDDFPIAHCAVLDVDLTSLGNIAFARGNSWRGDDFAEALRQPLIDYCELHGKDRFLSAPEWLMEVPK